MWWVDHDTSSAGIAGMDALRQDLRFAVRQMLRNPGFATVALLTLALGIGANGATFSVVNGLLLRALPYENPDRLVEINHFYPSLDGLEASVSAAGFRDYRERLPALGSVAAQSGWGVNLTGDGEPERLTGTRVSPSYFGTYGVTAARGRLFNPEEAVPGNDRVTVLSDDLWRRRFGADPEVVGRAITVNGEPYVVVGVLPATFRPFFQRAAEIFAPLALTEEQYSGGYTNEFLAVTARLAPGVTLEQARAEATRFAEQLKETSADGFPDDWGIRLTTLNERARGEIRPALLVLLGAVGFVLLIACANVANLLLARAAVRSREMGMRLAVGAGRARLLRQLIVESLVLSGIGAGMGLLLAWGAVRVVRRAAASSVPLIDQIGVDPWVVGFIGLLALLTALLFGLAPALQSARTDLQDTLREGSRGATGARFGLLRRGLVVTEFALALTLLAGAGLLVKSFARLTSVDPGFDPTNLLTFHVALPDARYPSDTARVQFFDRLLPELAATPGVEGVAATSVLPFSGGWSTGSFQVEGFQPGEGQPAPWGDIRVVNPDFARAMQIPVRQGRFFTDADRMDGPRVVVVDEEMVRRFWPDGDALGRRISFDGENWFSVVGVVGHASHEGLDAEARVQLYFPYKRVGVDGMFIGLRARQDAERLLPTVRTAVASVDRDQPISRIATMEQLMADTVGPRRLAAVLLGVFAAIALLLAATGVYGVISFNVSQRTRELGLRMAIGADRRDVVGMVMGQGLKLAALGVALGVLGALALNRVLSGQLYRVSPTDPSTLVLVAAVLVGVAVVSSLIPALRATGVDPAIALREE